MLRMRKRVFSKKIFAMFLIVVILLPYTSEVFAAVLTHKDETAMLETFTDREGRRG